VNAIPQNEPMNLPLEHYNTQRRRWPKTGRHILAQFDADSIVVYQAYRPSIGRFAAEHQRFGGDFSFGRMSWIKPNFLWMMYRSGWGTKSDQEITLAVRIKREGFDAILSEAVHSTFVPEVYGTPDAWAAAGERTKVRLQWDPDHDPTGAPQTRRAIQLGLRGPTLRRYATDWLLEVQDISQFVTEQHRHVLDGRLDLLQTPCENVYPVADTATAAKLGIDDPNGHEEPQ